VKSPDSCAQTLEVVVHSAQETRHLGALLGALLRGGEVLALCGDLGAGKTTLVQGLAAGMGISARVTSPTFILLNQYTSAAGRQLMHIDTYRLADGITLADAATFGLEELLAGEFDADDVIAIEWADRVEALLPADVLRIEIAAGAGCDLDARTIRMTATGERSCALLESARQSLHLQSP